MDIVLTPSALSFMIPRGYTARAFHLHFVQYFVPTVSNNILGIYEGNTGVNERILVDISKGSAQDTHRHCALGLGKYIDPSMEFVNP